MVIPTAKREFRDYSIKESSAGKVASAVAPAVADYANWTIKQEQIQAGNEISKMQNDLDAATNEYRRKAEANPNDENLKKEYEDNRSNLINKYKENIPFSARNYFEQSSTEISTKYDGYNNDWALKQNRDNSINHINDYVKNQTILANTIGKKGDVKALSDLYEQTSGQINQMATGYLGEETVAGLTKDLQGNIKLSGVSGWLEEDPVNALKILNDKDFISNIAPDKIDNLKQAAEARILRADDFRVKKEIIDNVQRPASLVARIADGEEIPLLELNQIHDKNPKEFSPEAWNWILKQRGYTNVTGEGGSGSSTKGLGGLGLKKQKELKLTDSQKVQAEADLTINYLKLNSQDKISAKDAADFNNNIFKALDMGAISPAAGKKFLMSSQVNWLDKINANLAQFGVTDADGKTLGYDQVMPWITEGTLPETEVEKGFIWDKNKSLGSEVNLGKDVAGNDIIINDRKFANSRMVLDKMACYDDALNKLAQEKGLKDASELEKNTSFIEKKMIYNEAANMAKDTYLKLKNPYYFGAAGSGAQATAVLNSNGLQATGYREGNLKTPTYQLEPQTNRFKTAYRNASGAIEYFIKENGITKQVNKDFYDNY